MALPDLLLGHLRSALSISRDVIGVSPACALVAVNVKDFKEIEDVGRLETHLSRFLTWSAVLHGAAAVDEVRVRIVARRGVRRRLPEIEILFQEDLKVARQER